ncbi:MAG: PKD domain-containing protein, partial [Thermoplasmata archaeon]
WDTPGGDFNTSYVSYRNISQEGLWYDWDITEIVRAWYAGDIENNGLMIIGDDHDAEPYNRAYFKTTENEDSHHWPKVKMSFGPEEIPDQYMEENEPTRTISLDTSYGAAKGISGEHGGSSNVPFDGENQDESRCQILHTPEQIGGEGTIKRISLGRYSPSQVGIFENLKISLAHTELEELTQTFADNYHGVPVEVFSVDKYETNSSDGDPWIHFELNESFTYDSSYNLLIDLQWQGDNGVKVETTSTNFDHFVTVNIWNISFPNGATSTFSPVTKFETEIADVSVVDKGESANMYPFVGPLPFNSEVFSEIRYQILQRSELLNASGTVDKICFQAFTNGADWSVVENLSIRMAHSSNESLGSNYESNRIDPWVEVLNRSTYKIASEQKGEWVEIDLDNLFRYNGDDNMVVDIRWRGGHAKYWGINLTVDTSVPYNGSLSYMGYDAESGTTVQWMHNIQTIFVDEPQWEATSSDPSLFTAEVMDENLEITPQPDQHGTGTIDLNMMNCNGKLVHQQDVMITIYEVNEAPDEPTNPSPVDGATDVGTSPTLSVDVSDPDGDTMDVTFYDASDDSIIGTDANVSSGDPAEVEWSDLLENTEYEWYAVAHDGQNTTQSVVWTFTTLSTNAAPDAPSNPSPADGATDVGTSPTLSVDVSDPDGDVMDITFYDASDDSEIGTTTDVASGSTAYVTWSDLNFGVEYEWYAVADDGQNTTQSDTWSFTTTAANQAPNAPSNPSPADGATDVGTSPTLSVTVSDPDGDATDVMFYDASDDSEIDVATGVASGSTASVTWSGLSLDAVYEWYAVADDGHDTTQSDTWSFTTMAVVDDESPVAVAGSDKTEIYAGETVNFDGSDSADNEGIVRYTWTIEGEEFDGVTVSYTFENPGTYTIRLVVEDAAGNIHEDTMQVTVTEKEEDSGFPLLWLALIIVIIIVILLLILLLTRKGSKGEEEYVPPPPMEGTEQSPPETYGEEEPPYEEPPEPYGGGVKPQEHLEPYPAEEEDIIPPDDYQ